MLVETILFGVVVVGIVLLFISMKTIRPTEKGVVERFGKYINTLDSGLHFIIPFLDEIRYVNITETMVDVEPQVVITKDKLNARIDAIVYYKVNDVCKSLYNVDDHKKQLCSLARTTLRSVMGQMSLTEANENRNMINVKVEEVLVKETVTYGVDILRVEIQRIEPPNDVQESMNKVVKAEQEKIAANDLATAVETKADGERRASIKKAEGVKRAKILEAEGDAEAKITIANAEAEKIKIENEAIQKYFIGNAQEYKKLETFERAYRNGTKYVIDSKSNIVNVMSDNINNVLPIHNKTKKVLE